MSDLADARARRLFVAEHGRPTYVSPASSRVWARAPEEYLADSRRVGARPQ
jgi:hypothetical protein